MLAARRHPSARPVCPVARRRARLLHVLSILLLGACQRVPLGDDEGGSDGPAETDSDGGGGSSGPPTSGPPPDPTPMYDCEPAGPSPCPVGQKCTAVSDGALQNHFKCVPDDGALPLYEPCVPDPEGGQDLCGAGTVCLAYSEDDPVSGRCFPLCRNNSDCEPGVCTTSPFTGTTFCADNCDPESPACLPGLGCRQQLDRFTCEMVLNVDTGLTGAACLESSARGCADTLACLPYALVPMCNSPSCCTTTCDLTEADTCPSPTICEPLFPTPAPGFENVGACFVPA